MTDPSDLPEVQNIGWVKHRTGFVIVLQVTQGDRVISREVLTPDATPEPRNAAFYRLVAEAGARFLLQQSARKGQQG